MTLASFVFWAKPWEIEQIKACLSKNRPDDHLAVNGATQFKDGNRNSPDAVNALLELTNGSIAPYVPCTELRDDIAVVGQ